MDFRKVKKIIIIISDRLILKKDVTITHSKVVFGNLYNFGKVSLLLERCVFMPIISVLIGYSLAWSAANLASSWVPWYWVARISDHFIVP